MSGRSVPLWVGATPDTAIPPRVIVRLALAQHGDCGMCGRPLAPGHFAADHVRALVNGGTNSEDNLMLVCVSPCHRDKSKLDVAEKSRVARKRAAHLGIKPKRQGFKGWRRFDGTIVRAEARKR